ncbi:MAG: hypothetical protein PGN13_01025 [Patulibacter minatonensis]
MRTVIDITPVSSHTAKAPVEPPVGDGRVAGGVARLKARLLAFVFALAAVTMTVVAASIGLFVFFVLLGLTVAIITVLVVRSWILRLTHGGPRPR